MDELAYYVGASGRRPAAALHAHSGVTLKESFKKKTLQSFCKKVIKSTLIKILNMI